MLSPLFTLLSIFVLFTVDQTSANNSTGYRYAKITKKSAFIRGRIPSWIAVRYSRFEYLSLHIYNWLLQFVICVCPISLSRRIFVWACVKIWVFGLTQVRLEIVILVNTIYGYHYQASTWLRYQRFENSLEVEPRVGTPICQSLVWIKF